MMFPPFLKAIETWLTYNTSKQTYTIYMYQLRFNAVLILVGIQYSPRTAIVCIT